jgi:hypothetical protein
MPPLDQILPVADLTHGAYYHGWWERIDDFSVMRWSATANAFVYTSTGWPGEEPVVHTANHHDNDDGHARFAPYTILPDDRLDRSDIVPDKEFEDAA